MKYRSKENNTQVVYTPLTLTCEIICVTPSSPVTQASNSLNNEYEPDRTVSPTVLLPVVKVRDLDGIFPSGAVNYMLSLDSIKWTVNGIIELTRTGSSKTSEWADTDFSIITTEDDNRGALTIKKNVPAGGKYELSFTAKFTDWRTGTVIVANSSNTVVLTTTDKGVDQFGISVDNASSIYNPLQDELLLWDYLNGKGLPTSGTRESHINALSYQRTSTVTLTRGVEALTSVPEGYTFGVYDVSAVDGASPLEPSSAEHPEILSVSFPTVVLDLRMIAQAEYEVRLVKKSPAEGESAVKARAHISVIRKMPAVTMAKPMRNSDVPRGMSEYFNFAIVMVDKNEIAYPELYYEIQWFTQNRVKNASGSWIWSEETKRNIGVQLRVALADIGITDVADANSFRQGFEVDERKAATLLLDDDGKPLTDDEGNFLID